MSKGIRIFDLELTDALAAKGLGFRQDYVDIYSNSWGPPDNGYEVAEVGVMTEEVLRRGALKVCLDLVAVQLWGLVYLLTKVRIF